MSLYDEYEGYVLKYVQEYGHNTVILYRCGSFYEIYSINDGLVDMKRLSELLNIQVSRRNKAILEVNRSNTLMAGFPMYTLQKFINILVNDNFTVVVVDQISEPPKPKRAVTNIISPGTDIINVNCHEAKNLMSLWIDKINDNKSKRNLIAVGVAILDLSTGKSKVFELASTFEDPFMALDEAYKIIRVEAPKEIILLGDDLDLKDLVFKHLDLNKEVICVHDRFMKYDNAIKNITYQNQLLQRVFPSYGLLSVIEYLDLEKMPLATTSFVFLLQFSYQHNETILNKIQKPTIDHTSDTLNLSYNCVKHLNIISDNPKDSSLLSLLNKTCTSMGKRLFREWFLSPLIDPIQINARYQITADMMVDQKYNTIQLHLEQIYDLERLARRITLALLNPCELFQVHTSLIHTEHIIDYLKKSGLHNCLEDLHVSELVDYIETHIDLMEVQKYNQDNISRNFFCHGVYKEIDELQSKLNTELCFIEKVCNALNSSVKAEVFKVEYNQVDKHHLTITKKRFNDVKNNLKNFSYCDFFFKDVITKTLPAKPNIKIHHNSFKNSMEIIQESLSKEIKEKFLNLLQDICSKYNSILYKAAEFVAKIDFYASNAKSAFMYRYHLPIIADEYQGKSYVHGEDMRHPIIERICTNISYVSNNICIGTPEIDGILLYGTNMVGKSSYMKALGICVIMAQAGMFVPCRNFRYVPYKHIFTRIPSGDDIYKGQSTFALEITELRNIIRRASSDSLVIGDELASGTESISAVAIVGAGIVQLTASKASFVFATHLHDLTKLNSIANNKTLKVFHLSVEYDEVAKKLIYDRKLKDGQGSTLYGLEVCRALDLPDSFITLSNQFRQELLNIEPNIVSSKRSKYNSKQILDKCDVCKSKGVEVHHINPQVQADMYGFINDIHKNDKHNLMNVCESCHDKIHRDEIKVEGYVQTSNGIELKFSEHVIDEKEVYKIVQDLTLKGISKQKIKVLLAERGINVTLYKLNKMLHPINVVCN